MGKHKHITSNRGFTIVELLIVIVIVAVLAAITIVAYNGIQQRARDSQRKSDLAQIAKALHLYGVDKGNYLSDGTCAQAGGWFMTDYDSAGPLVSMNQCLINSKHLPTTINDPLWLKGCTTTSGIQECFYYMKYDCGTTTYLFANLEGEPHSTTATDSTCMASLDSAYGMDYIVRIN